MMAIIFGKFMIKTIYMGLKELIEIFVILSGSLFPICN